VRLTGRDADSAEDALRRLGRIRGDAVGPITSFDDLDRLAAASALEDTRNLLYDLSRRTQIAAITRNIFPFGEVFIEIFGTWGRLVKEGKGLPIRRLQQGVEGARDAGFFTSDENGREIFIYPGQQLLQRFLFRDDPDIEGGQVTPRETDIQFGGSVQSLNLVSGSILPGFTPVVQAAVSVFEQIPILGRFADTPTIENLKRIVSPFGVETSEEATDILRLAIPTWFRRVLGMKGLDQQLAQSQASTTMEVLKQLFLEEGIFRPDEATYMTMLKRAERISGRIALVRTIGAFIAPTAPVPIHMVEDKDAIVWELQTLSTDYHEKLKNVFDGDEVATFRWFMSSYGFDPFLISTGKTVAIRTRSFTSDGFRHQQANRVSFELFPETAYFANPDIPDQFDRDSIRRQLDEDARANLTPDQWMQRRNRSLGNVIMEVARQKVGERTDEAATDFLRQTRHWIEMNYRGFNINIVGLPARADNKVLIRELAKWESHTPLAQSEVGKAVISYMTTRANFVKAIQDGGLIADVNQPFTEHARAEPFRQALRDKAIALIRKYPQFEAVWEQVLQRELKENEDLLQQTALQTGISVELLLKPVMKSLSRRIRDPGLARQNILPDPFAGFEVANG